MTHHHAVLVGHAVLQTLCGSVPYPAPGRLPSGTPLYARRPDPGIEVVAADGLMTCGETIAPPTP